MSATPPPVKGLGLSMPRDRYQRGELKLVGKRNRKWRGFWYVYYRDEQGRERRKHRSAIIGLKARMTKGEAQSELDRRIQEETAQTPSANARLTVRQFINDVFIPIRSKRWRQNTRRALVGCLNAHILPVIGDVALADLKKAQIEKLLIALSEKGLKYQTVDRALVILKMALKEAVANKYISDNPAVGAKPPEMTRKTGNRELSAAEVQRLFAAPLRVRDRLVFRVGILCGMRAMEIFALRKDDLMGDVLRIDEQAQHGKATPIKTSRYVSVRYAPMPPALRRELEMWAECIEDHGLLFPGSHGRITTPRAEQEGTLKRARKESGIADLTFQMLRPTFATLYAGDVKDCQQILGHTTLKTTDIYKRHIPERQLRDVTDLERRLSVLPTTAHRFATEPAKIAASEIGGR